MKEDVQAYVKAAVKAVESGAVASGKADGAPSMSTEYHLRLLVLVGSLLLL